MEGRARSVGRLAKLGFASVFTPCIREQSHGYANISHVPVAARRRHGRRCITLSATTEELGLTPELEKLTKQFAAVPDSKLRYQQLLFLASSLAPMSSQLKTAENKVPGCLSVVHVDAAADRDGKITFVGDSDAQLTKGLIALLIRGLNGHSAEEIAKVDPNFIETSGLAVSLTPGRNNGFLNMLATMKAKATSAAQGSSAPPADSSPPTPTAGVAGRSPPDGGSMRARIEAKLSLLKPSELTVQDNSDKHAGHVGARPEGETHFAVRVHSAAFEGLSLVKRHKVVYTLLAEEMQESVHALEIDAKTPAEAEAA